VAKRHGGNHGYDRGDTRGDHRSDGRNKGNRRDNPLRADAKPLPLPPPANDHREENQGAIKSHEASRPASWMEPKLHYRIDTSKQLSREIVAAQ
jgi:hypothetical protein